MLETLLIVGDPLFQSHLTELVVLTARYAIPAIMPARTFPDAGGLMSYGANLGDAARINGVYVGRILKGEKPADLPVQQSTRIEMVLNLKTAKALGIEVPTATLLRADRGDRVRRRAMRRRDFIAGVGGMMAGVAAQPFVARAQQRDACGGSVLLMLAAESDQRHNWSELRSSRAFRSSDGLMAATSGSTIAGEPADVDRISHVCGGACRPATGRALRRRHTVLAALQQATRSIPIVFALVADPIGGGFVASFARPGGNITGFMPGEPPLAGKWLELLKEAAPQVRRVAFLYNPETAPYAQERSCVTPRLPPPLMP